MPAAVAVSSAVGHPAGARAGGCVQRQPLLLSVVIPAIHTLGLRDLAVRLVHAPVLSLASSHRMPRAGCLCVELPASRVYPSGDLPTPISGMSGNLELLRVLARASAGKYNP
jgi:hypothetical protein